MKCPDGGIGRHAGLRSQYFGVRVRVSLGAPTVVSEYGGIGRHKRLKISRRKVCRFDSGYSHQVLESWPSGRRQRLAKPSS